MQLCINPHVVDKNHGGDYDKLNKGFLPFDIDAEELAQHVKDGHALCPAMLKVSDGGYYIRKNENFDWAEIVGVDIDNTIPDETSKRGARRRRNASEGYVTVDEFISSEWIRQNAVMVYTTPSHTPDWHKFRVIFRLAERITSKVEYKKIVKDLINRLEGDQNCSAEAQVFYGNTAAETWIFNRTLPMSEVRRTAEQPFEVRREQRAASTREAGSVSREVCEAMLSHIPPQNDYLFWVKIISGVGKMFDEDTTVQIIENWSPGKPGEVRSKLRNPLDRVNFGTVIYWARQCGWTPPAGFFPEAENVTYPYTDAGNAERFVDMYKDKVRYEALADRWYIWDGTRFKLDDKRVITGYAVQCARSIAKDAEGVQDEKKRNHILGFAARSESRSGLENMLKLAASGTDLVYVTDDFDSHPELINLANGIFNLDTMELAYHDPSRLITKKVNIELDTTHDFDEDVHCPCWMKFLYTIFDGDREMISYIQTAIGYSLSGYINAQVLFFLFGSGKNGKSVFLSVLRLITEDYYQQAAPDMLLAKITDGVPNDVARLRGARIVVGSELPENKRFDEVKLKSLTGSDRITARYLHKEFFEFYPTHKLWLSGNHKPAIIGNDEGIWRRLHLIPFTVTIPDEQRRPEYVLMEEFRRERSAILRWAIEGFAIYRETEKFRVPEKVRNATVEYREDMNVVGRFVKECLVTDSDAMEKSVDVWRAFQLWAKDSNEYLFKRTKFDNKMADLGFTREMLDNPHQVHYMNLRIDDDIRKRLYLD